MLNNDLSLTKTSEINNTEWQDWVPIWSVHRKNTPHDFQEQHSPTANSKNKNTSSRTKARIVDERLWSSMKSCEQDAAIEIANSFNTLTKGIGFTTIDLEKIPGGSGNISELHAELIGIYMKWGENCIKSGLSHSIVIDILCFGHSCIDIDSRRRMRKGSAKKNLLQGLALYCNIRGWY